jgi:hypothetical protein
VKVKQEVWKMASLAEVDDVDGAARYMGGYLNMQSYRVRKYIMSAGWVFPGWIGFSQWFKKEFGIYPPREMLVELGRMSKEEREEHTWFGLYLWEKKHLVGNKVFCKCKIEIDGDEEKDYYSVL